MKIDDFILNSNGKFISVLFEKNSGEPRFINGRLGVVKHLKGGRSNLNPMHYITIFDIKSNGYRAIARDSIKKVTCDGLTITNNA